MIMHENVKHCWPGQLKPAQGLFVYFSRQFMESRITEDMPVKNHYSTDLTREGLC